MIGDKYLNALKGYVGRRISKTVERRSRFASGMKEKNDHGNSARPKPKKAPQPITYQYKFGDIRAQDSNAKECYICLDEVQDLSSFFPCKRHLVHSDCLKKYTEASNMPNQYLCPVKCTTVNGQEP